MRQNMICKNKLMELLDNNKTITINLKDVEIIFLSEELKQISMSASRAFWMTKIIVKDENLGNIFLSSFSQKFKTLSKGQKISLTVTVTGKGQPSQKYPDPLLFAKAKRGAGIAITQ